MTVAKNKILGGDKIIWIVYILFIFISIVEVFASMGRKVGGASFVPTLGFHCLWLFIGFVCCFIMHKIDYRNVTKWLKVLLIISIVLTCVPYIVAHFSNEGLSTARWIRLDFGFYKLQFQPSEIAKYIIIFYLCSIMASKQAQIATKEVFWSCMIPLGIVCGIVFWSNFSTSLLIFVTSFLLMRIGGVNKKYLYLTILILGSIIGILLLIAYYAPEFVEKIGRIGTAAGRITGKANTDYTQITQPNQALIAVATGGLLGVGIGHSTQSWFLKEGHNDFIFSIILEEGGMWLGGFIILLYIILLYRMFRIARNIDGYFGAMACLGLGIVITLQALINMSVAVGLIPVTGQTLPFISYGGTSFVFASVFLGLILNISKKMEKIQNDAVLKEEITQNSLQKTQEITTDTEEDTNQSD